MSDDYVITSLPEVRLVATRAIVPADELGVRVGPMFDGVAARIGHRPGSLAIPIATYEMSGEDMRVVVGYATAGEPPEGTESVELPAVDAVCRRHLGPLTSIRESWSDLHRWIAEHGYTPSGPARELYVVAERDDQSDWVTELQQPIASVVRSAIAEASREEAGSLSSPGARPSTP